MDLDHTHVDDSDVKDHMPLTRKQEQILAGAAVSKIRWALAQCGISPKVIASAITGLLVFALTKLAIPLDPILEQFINAVAMAIAAYLAPPGRVLVQPVH